MSVITRRTERARQHLRQRRRAALFAREVILCPRCLQPEPELSVGGRVESKGAGSAFRSSG